MATRKTANFVREKILLADSATREEEKGLLKTIARHTIGSSFVEEDPAVSEWFRGLAPTTTGVAQYVRDLFPSASWARRYNMHWLIGDAIAGEQVSGVFKFSIANKWRRDGRPRSSTAGYGVCLTGSTAS